jgi:hypothetical protein
MKIVNVTKNKTIRLPNAFTMKELMVENPGVSKNTLYQRIQSMLREGDASPIKVVGDVKRGVKVDGGKPVLTRGRTEIAYALVDASDGNNLIRQVKAQGVAKLKKQNEKQGVTVAKIGDTSSNTDTEANVDVPTITNVEPLPDATIPASV